MWARGLRRRCPVGVGLLGEPEDALFPSHRTWRYSCFGACIRARFLRNTWGAWAGHRGRTGGNMHPSGDRFDIVAHQRMRGFGPGGGGRGAGVRYKGTSNVASCFFGGSAPTSRGDWQRRR